MGRGCKKRGFGDFEALSCLKIPKTLYYSPFLWFKGGQAYEEPTPDPPAPSGHTPRVHPWGARSGFLKGGELNFTEFLDAFGVPKTLKEDFPALTLRAAVGQRGRGG